MLEPASAAWCARFPGSAVLDDLAEPFQAGATAFVQALRIASADVTISATYRPQERAYLMHFCCLVAGYFDKDKVFHQIAAAEVPAMLGVEIDWTCGGDSAAAKHAAAEMVRGYGIVYPAQLVSNHTRRKALDMTVRWTGVIHVRTKFGSLTPVELQQDLWPVGASYGVHKLASDAPHWSIDGH